MTNTLALLLVVQAEPAGIPPYILYQIPLIIAIFYFLVIRPQQKQRKQQEERLRNVRKGDEIVTAGGIIGKVENIKETLKDGAPVKTMEDRVTIRSLDSRFVIERGRIARIITEPATEPKPTA